MTALGDDHDGVRLLALQVRANAWSCGQEVVARIAQAAGCLCTHAQSSTLRHLCKTSELSAQCSAA